MDANATVAPGGGRGRKGYRRSCVNRRGPYDRVGTVTPAQPTANAVTSPAPPVPDALLNASTSHISRR